MPFRARRSYCVLKTGLSGLSNKKNIRKRRKKLCSRSCSRSYSKQFILDAVEGLLMLQKTNDGCRPPVLDVVWPSPRSTPFIVTPIRNTFDATEQVQQYAAREKCVRNILRELINHEDQEILVGGKQAEIQLKEFPVDAEQAEFGKTGLSEDDRHSSVETDQEILVDGKQAEIQHKEFPVDAEQAEFGKTGLSEDDRHNSVETSTCSTQTDADVTYTSLPKVVWAHWSYNSMRGVSKKEFRRLTGLSQRHFEILYTFLGGDTVCGRLKYNYRTGTPKTLRSRLQLKDRLFMTLVRIRRGFSVEDVALLFGISVTHVCNIFYVWVQFIYLQFKRIQKDMFMTRHDQKEQKLPPAFLPFKNFRVVLDSTEVRIETPYHYQQQGNTYSTYKAGNVILYLIGCNAFGAVSFIGPGYEGSISDRELFKRSGIQEFLEPGDLLLVDRGFHVQDLVDLAKVKILHPPFLGKRTKLSPEEELLFKLIAHARVHVERVIRKIKCFKILKNVTNKMLPILDQLVYICGCLVNFDPNNIIGK